MVAGLRMSQGHRQKLGRGWFVVVPGPIRPGQNRECHCTVGGRATPSVVVTSQNLIFASPFLSLNLVNFTLKSQVQGLIQQCRADLLKPGNPAPHLP